jgi:hypothetical protein
MHVKKGEKNVSREREKKKGRDMSKHLSMIRWCILMHTFLGLCFADTPDGLVDFEAVVSRELLNGQVEFGIIQYIVRNLVGDSWPTGAI